MTLRPLLRTVGVVAGLVGAQVAWTIWRPLPSFEDLDPDGFEGPEGGRRIRIVAVGDSSCTGSGLTDPADVWLRVLARRLGVLGYRVEIRSFAVGGAKAGDVVRDQLDDAVAAAGDIALVSVGGNDALRGEPLERFETHLDTITRRLSAVSPIVVLSGVGDIGTVPRLPRMLSDVARRRGVALDRIHKRVAERHGIVAADQWERAAERFRDPAMFSDDLFHPNRLGHIVWADVAFRAVSPLLATRLPHA